MKSLSFPKKVEKAYNKVRRNYLKTVKLVPQVFSDRKVKPAAIKYIQENFPIEHYGADIDGMVFEGWGLRSLLESVFNSGFIQGQNPAAWRENYRTCIRLGKLLEKFRFKIGRRTFHPTLVEALSIEGDEVLFRVNLQTSAEGEYAHYRVPLKEYEKEHRRVMRLSEKILATKF